MKIYAALTCMAMVMNVCHPYNMNKMCESNGGMCTTKVTLSNRCSRLPYVCEFGRLCCRNESSRKTKRRGSGISVRRLCSKTDRECKNMGGICLAGDSKRCKLGIFEGFCKGSSCKCCIGEKKSCGILPECRLYGGFCIEIKHSKLCKGTVNDKLCDEAGCTCCFPDKKCKCGPSNEVRIIGGTELKTQNKYPWMVRLTMFQDKGTFQCGGTLINDRYVLTAAHCVHDESLSKYTKPRNLKITLADHDQSSTEDDIPGVTRDVAVAAVIPHKKYDDRKFEYDIALLKLKKPLDLLEYKEISAACLPRSASENFAGIKATVIGWGLTDYSDGSSSPDILNIVNVPILEPGCNGYIPDKFKVKEHMLCTGTRAGGKGACLGDSGGPLVVNEGGIYTLVGMPSVVYITGDQCGGPKTADLYTRVSSFLDWISERTRDAEYCS
ncbi:Transmembrane protease serine 6 [Halocaridina rubra]|uniref:Transmembrane protease serine 6 n=1 Tax=Halocaridina rubra TaxID=373956 RepID=A0AAN9ADX9_HALRR